MGIGALTEGDKIKIKSLINDGVQVMHDIEAQKEGLKETIEALAEELDIKKQVLNKAVRIAYKNSKNQDALGETRTELDEVEEVLMAAGKA